MHQGPEGVNNILSYISCLANTLLWGNWMVNILSFLHKILHKKQSFSGYALFAPNPQGPSLACLAPKG